MTTPTIRLLGPIHLHAPGPRPTSPARATELLTLLALHPEGITTDHLDEALWPHRRITALTRNPLVTAARTWLGTTPGGQPRLPYAHGGTYTAQLNSDWTSFQQHLEGHTPEAATTSQLRAALDLVTGSPLSGVNPARYAWAEIDRSQMITLIAHAAQVLATRSLKTRDNPGATTATAIGLTVEPASEILWRLALLAAHHSGDQEHLHALCIRLWQVLEPLGPLESRTRQLLQRLDEAHPAGLVLTHPPCQRPGKVG